VDLADGKTCKPYELGNDDYYQAGAELSADTFPKITESIELLGLSRG